MDVRISSPEGKQTTRIFRFSFRSLFPQAFLTSSFQGARLFNCSSVISAEGVVFQKYKDIPSKHGCSDYEQKSDTVMVSLSRKTLCAALVALQRSHIPRIGERRIIIPWNEISSIVQFAPEGLLNDLRT